MAADRLTQLQEAINAQAENFVNSIGVLQQVAGPSNFPELHPGIIVRNQQREQQQLKEKQQQLQQQQLLLQQQQQQQQMKAKQDLVEPQPGSSKSAEKDLTKTAEANTKSTSNLIQGPSEKIKQNLFETEGSISEDLVKALENEILAQYDGKHDMMFARLIARTAKNIDTLIDSLPSVNEDTQELYSASIRRLEAENAEYAAKLEKEIQIGEAFLAQIQEAITEIAQVQTGQTKPKD